MSRIAQYSLFLLAVVLPFQNALIKFAVNKLALPEWLSFWKEGLTLILMSYFLSQIWLKLHHKKYKIRWHYWQNKWPLAAVTLATILILFSSFFYNQISVSDFVVGFRFELWWLWFFAIVATWWLSVAEADAHPNFSGHLKLGVYIGFVVCAVVTLIGLFVGQQTLASIWNSESTSSQFLTSAPNCHVVDYQVEGCRLSGPFSTPNHLTGYLLLVLPVFLVSFIDSLKNKQRFQTWRFYFDATAIALIGLFVALSFSRYAWLGLAAFAVFMFVFFGVQYLPKKKWVTWAARIDLSAALLVPLFIATIAVSLPAEALENSFLPDGLIKPSSTALHARHTAAGLQILENHPERLGLGYGLPSAGPAARLPFIDEYDNPMIMENGFIAYKNWLLPADLAIPENWFLQVVLNGGLIYFFLYSSLVFLPLYTMFRAIVGLDVSKPFPYKPLLYGLGFFSIILGNLLLHIWENQTIALYWTLVWLYSRY